MNEAPVVLSVDDEPAVTGLVRLYLNEAGYEVMAAASANEALHVIRERRPDLISVDLMLPDIDGFSFCELLRQSKSTASIPRGGADGLDLARIRKFSVKLGARAYLNKPFTSGQLVKQVREILDSRLPAARGRARKRNPGASSGPGSLPVGAKRFRTGSGLFTIPLAGGKTWRSSVACATSLARATSFVDHDGSDRLRSAI